MLSHWTHIECTSCLAVCLLITVFYGTIMLYLQTESDELCVYTVTELHAHMCTGLLSKHSIYTKQCHICMTHSTVQHPSSWTVMAWVLTFHDHPFYNQFCWPVVPGSGQLQGCESVSPTTAQITLSAVFGLLVQCCTGTVPCLTAILVCEIWVKVTLALTAASYLVGTK